MKALLLAPMGSVHRRFNKVNIEALKSLGYEVHLVANFSVGEGTEKQNAEYVEFCRTEGIITHSIPYQRHSLIGSLACIAETKELFLKEKFDLIHAHTETGGLILRLCNRPLKNCKYIYTPHGMSFYKGSSLKSQILYRPVEKWICSGMDINIAINGEEFDVLKSWNENSARFVHGIGLDIERFAKYNKTREDVRKLFNIPNDAFVVVSVGELDDNKNHRVVIEALSKIQRDDVYYIVCGVGPNKNKLEDLAKINEFADKLVLAGYRSDIPDILHASDCFAFPSIHEGLPVSVMEAMAAGLPVVASKIRGNVDLIENSVNGYVIKFDDVEQWRLSINNIYNNRSLVEEFVAYSNNMIKKYSNYFVLDEFFNIY